MSDEHPLLLSGLSVLVVEDDEDMRYLLREYLSHYGAHVTTAYNGVEALSLLTRYGVNIIVTDMSMPTMDGMKFFQQLRTLPDQSHRLTPVIACTAYRHLRDAARDAGFDAYLTKPLDPYDIVKEVARLAGRAAA